MPNLRELTALEPVVVTQLGKGARRREAGMLRTWDSLIASPPSANLRELTALEPVVVAQFVRQGAVVPNLRELTALEPVVVTQLGKGARRREAGMLRTWDSLIASPLSTKT